MHQLLKRDCSQTSNKTTDNFFKADTSSVFWYIVDEINYAALSASPPLSDTYSPTHTSLFETVTETAEFFTFLVLSLFQPFLQEKLKVHDTCGVHNLHGMPGVFGGILSAIFAALATKETYNEESRWEELNLQVSCQKNYRLSSRQQQTLGWPQVKPIIRVLGLARTNGQHNAVQPFCWALFSQVFPILKVCWGTGITSLRQFINKVKIPLRDAGNQCL